MHSLADKDYELIAKAQKAIQQNYDEENHNHTVGAAVRCKSGKIYIGVNVYSLHGACAEQVAIGAAVTCGEREFEAIVAVRGKNGENPAMWKLPSDFVRLYAGMRSDSFCSREK